MADKDVRENQKYISDLEVIIKRIYLTSNNYRVNTKGNERERERDLI